jgi:ketosteroid isomerase-like protein
MGAAAPKPYSGPPGRTVHTMSERHVAWISAYETAWRTAGTSPLQRLFTDGATYRAAPFDEPLTGRDAIARFWEEEREGPDEVFTIESAIVAAEGDTAVARIEVVYGDPPRRTYRDLWIIVLAGDGRCSHFEEWPFHPGQARTAA